MSVQKLQNLIDTKQFDPSSLTRDQVFEMDTLFENGVLTGYKNTSEIARERNVARQSIAVEAERADRPIEAATQGTPVIKEVNRSTFELVGDITGSIVPYIKDRQKLKDAFLDTNYRNRFGIAYPERFLNSIKRLKDQAGKVTLAAAGKTPAGRIAKGFFSLGGLLNKVENSGKQLLRTKRNISKYGLTQPLQTEIKSVLGGGIGAAAGSAAYDVADFASEFASSSQVDLGTISDNDLDKMSMPARLFTKAIDAGTNSIMWGAGVSALSGPIGRNLRQFGRLLTGTKGAQSELLARQAAEKGTPLSLTAIADESTTFGSITKGFGKVFGVLPFVNSKIQANMKKFDLKAVNYFGRYLSGLAPMGYSDLMGKEFQDIVKKNHADNMTMIDKVYKTLDQVTEPIADLKFIPTTTLKKFSEDLEAKIIKGLPGGQAQYEKMVMNPSAKRLSGLSNDLVQFAVDLKTNVGDFITKDMFQNMKQSINTGIQTGGNDRLSLVARDLRNFMDIDLASVTGKNIKNLRQSADYQRILAEKKAVGQRTADAWEQTVSNTVNKFGKDLEMANDFYSRVISPYSEGMLKKLGQQADGNLFTALGELNIAGKATVEPEMLFRKIGNVVFRDGTDRTIKELKTLIGYDKVVKINGQNATPGKDLFNAMRSRFIFDSYLRSFVDPKTNAGADLVARMSAAASDNSLDALQTFKIQREMSPEAARVLKRSEIATDPRRAAEARGFKPGQVQTTKIGDVKVDINSLGQFDFEQFGNLLGLKSSDPNVQSRLIAMFGDGSTKKGAQHVENLEELMDVLSAHYSTKLGSTSSFLARRAGLSGVQGMLGVGGAGGMIGGGAVGGFVLGGAGGGIFGMLLPSFILRHLGGVISDPKQTSALLDVFTAAERKEQLVKQIYDRNGNLINERFKFNLLEPIGKGLSPRKRQSLGRFLNFVDKEEEDFPGTDPMKVTNKDIAEFLLKNENKPINIPDDGFNPETLPNAEKAHIYPEVYRMQQMNMTDREMYNSYLDGNREAVRQDDGTIMREIDNANRVEEEMPQTQQPNVAPVMPATPQQTDQTNAPVSYEQLFPNDELGIGIQNRQR